MWLDDSNRGGGEPPQGHPPVIAVVGTAFVDVDLSLPGFQAQPETPTKASFTIGFCGHGAMVVNIRGCAVMPLPRYLTRWQRLVLATRYALGHINAPEQAEEPTDGA